jgi:NAD(P)-dependent dehydrogenase (short-subunit alcohol dehydrogenase family)
VGALSKKVTLVTGGASGMGRATCLSFAREGASVVVADIDGDGAAETASLCGGDAAAVVVDVSIETHVAEAVEAAVSSFGRLDALVNYAGVRQPHVSFDELTVDVWDSMFAVHARGAFLCLKHGSRAIAASGGGSVVLVSSMGGVEGYGSDAAVGYCAAKAAVIQLALSVVPVLGPKSVRVNVLVPGYVGTPMGYASLGADAEAMALMQPLPRAGMPDDIAALALFLAGDESEFLTGAVVRADGGYTTLGGRSMVERREAVV